MWLRPQQKVINIKKGQQASQVGQVSVLAESRRLLVEVNHLKLENANG